MARSKSSTSTILAPFQRQAYQSWYLDGYSLVQFTKLMDILFKEMEKITFWRISASERQWRTCKTVWDNVWNIKGGGIAHEGRLGLEALHVWFCKSPRGGIIWKPLGLEPLTLATLLPGLAQASDTPQLAGQPLRFSENWDGTGNDEGCGREHKPQPSYSNPASSESDRHYPKASPSDTNIPNTNSTGLVSYSQPRERNPSMEEVLGNYTPYSQLNDGSCILTGQAVSETASSIHDVAPYRTISSYQGTVCTPDRPARPYVEWPDSVTQGCQCIPTSNNTGLDRCQNDTSQMDWLAAINF